MQLKKFQDSFVNMVTAQMQENELLEMIIPSGQLTEKEAIEVYSLDYSARLQEAMGSNYEATWLLLGDEDFFELSQNFIKSNPSHEDSLTNYGENFPEFLLLHSVDFEIIQMAQFERCFWKLFHSAHQNDVIITQEHLENSTFKLDEIYLYETDLRLDLIWQSREKEMDALSELNLYEKSYFVLFKKFEKVEILKISDSAYLLLKELKEVQIIKKMSSTESDPQVWAEVLSILKFAELS